MYIHRNAFILSTGCFTTCPDYFRIFSGLFGDIPRNVWGHSPEYLTTFPGMFGDIPRNVWGHSPECLGTFSGMFGDIPRNITFPPFLVFPTFPVPVFLVLYIACVNMSNISSCEFFIVIAGSIFDPPSSPEQFLKNSPGTAWFRGNFYLIWFVNCKTIEINSCNAVNFPWWLI